MFLLDIIKRLFAFVALIAYACSFFFLAIIVFGMEKAMEPMEYFAEILGID